ncbi:DUF6457 domain-containing protein [Ancrocorticia populi]|uniref:Molybdopterin-guanine dinucleotide biosynthesis protein n=1 Tax=Ancrocorticia populi TaxID=2175228 RepID=A0A2V1KBD6_9ACTO|nr:DUF6457 domain-containing protein [Ancrocorticia populi]MDN6487215.1 DUF6457 domain-containing protein [Ancrocorticia sp.]PWF27041.1 molybdopterin-guanine dinucleotide biosynthesis protein [Ancrocorticia populi]
MAHKDDPEKMAKLAAWLEAAAEELGVDPSVVTDNQTDLLGLIDTVAHGPSRPGAPLTAFLVGYAAASQDRNPSELVELLEKRAQGWDA